MNDILWPERICELGTPLQPTLRFVERPHGLNDLKGWLLEYGKSEILDCLIPGSKDYLSGFTRRFEARGFESYHCLDLLIGRLTVQKPSLTDEELFYLLQLHDLYRRIFVLDALISARTASGEALDKAVIHRALEIALVIESLTFRYHNKHNRHCPACPQALPGATWLSWHTRISPVEYYVKACNASLFKRLGPRRPARPLWDSIETVKSRKDKQALILIVDDESQVCDLMKLLLELRGGYHRIHIEHDGESGLQAAYRLRPDLILLNNLMPMRSGIEVCRVLRSDPSMRDVRIVIHSASSSAEEAAREVGAQHFLRTPFSVEALLSVVRKVLSSESAQPKG